jgi:response regulator RpfG family c-di-GMP phosphodiesterase
MLEVDDWLFTDSPKAVPAPLPRLAWKVLIVDDEEEVHRVTRLVLQHFEFDGRGLALLHARSGAEACRMLADQPDIALVLLDVVMEDDHAGLEVVRHIREQLGNKLIRIVLRTGQPGQAPEHEVIAAYDINDYKEKTELTSQKLKTLLFSSLRSYRDLLIIDANRQGLERVIQATTRIFEQRELQRFASAVLMQLTGLLQLERNAVYCKVSEGFMARRLADRLIIEAGTGDYEPLVSMNAVEVLPEPITSDLRHALHERQSIRHPDRQVLFYASSSGAEGVLFVGHNEPLEDFERELLGLFCTNVSIAFENLHLNRELEESQKEMVYLLGEAIESRSNETGSHVKRVADISHFLALKYGVDAAAAELIRVASPMHDIGKIGIPDAILNKPGKHTADEWEVMKRHAQLGYEMLRQSHRRVFQIAASLAHEHHEHWDGQGYPRGLAGEAISIEGRVTAIADVIDALLSVRCYKPAWTPEQVLEFVRSERGRKFDPTLVNIVEREFEQIIALRNAHPD